jgi:hypothetical protein
VHSSAPFAVQIHQHIDQVGCKLGIDGLSSSPPGLIGELPLCEQSLSSALMVHRVALW